MGLTALKTFKRKTREEKQEEKDRIELSKIPEITSINKGEGFYFSINSIPKKIHDYYIYEIDMYIEKNGELVFEKKIKVKSKKLFPK